MPDKKNPIGQQFDPAQASIMDTLAKRLARRIYASIQGGAQGELGVAAMGATQPVAGGPVRLATKAVQSGAVKAPSQIAAGLDRFGYGDLTDALADQLLRTGPGGANISEIGVQKMIRGMGYDEATKQIANEAANNPEYIRGLLDFVTRRLGDR